MHTRQTQNVTRRASGRCQSSFYRPLASIVMSAVFMKIRKFKMAAEREISAAVRALRSLRDGVGNFILFEQEVKDTLNSIFEKHQTERNVFAQVRLSRIQVGPVIEEEITIWLKSMQRRLRGRMRARDPWTIVFTRDIPQRIFKCFMEVVRNAVSSFGVSCTETRLTDAISYTKLVDRIILLCKLSLKPHKISGICYWPYRNINSKLTLDWSLESFIRCVLSFLSSFSIQFKSFVFSFKTRSCSSFRIFMYLPTLNFL